MPIKHIAFLRFKQGTHSSLIEDFIKQLNDVGKSINGFIGVKGGRYSSQEGLNQGFTYSFIMTFVDEQARNTYLSHPGHQRIARQIIDNLEGGLLGAAIFDFDYDKKTMEIATKIEKKLTEVVHLASNLSPKEFGELQPTLSKVFEQLSMFGQKPQQQEKSSQLSKTGYFS